MGIVFDIKKYAIHDGPGIRTTVFLKGCPLHCAWCHNPESWRAQPEVGVRAGRCVRCGECVKVCPENAASSSSQVTQHETCRVCGSCVRVCAGGAREIIGEEMTVAQVIREVEKDVVFYDESGGGVTFSGGDPLMQSPFLIKCLSELVRRDIHTAVDTSCYADPENLRCVAAKTDLFLCDIKHMDGAKHDEYTGVDNKLILANIEMLAKMGNRIIMRIPIIPGFNEDDENMQKTAQFIKGLTTVFRVDVLPYNPGGFVKAQRLSGSGGIRRFEVPTDSQMADVCNVFDSFGLAVHAGG